MSCSRPFLVSLRVGVEDVPASQSAGDLSAPRIVAITAVCLVAAPFTLEACAEDVCRESSAGGSCRGIERGRFVVCVSWKKSGVSPGRLCPVRLPSGTLASGVGRRARGGWVRRSRGCVWRPRRRRRRLVGPPARARPRCGP